MYTTCPKCQYTRQASDSAPSTECPSCGLVFSKWLKNLVADTELSEAVQLEIIDRTWKTKVAEFFVAPRPGIARGDVYVYLVIWLVFLAWGLDFVMMDISSNAIGQSWFHNVDLIFHEAGHMLFIPFGRTLSILGGSLFQVLLPLMLVFAFLFYNRDGFAASICLWWTGQSMMDVAPYIADARALRLPLLGGGTGADRPGSHDWANLLRPRGLLEYDLQIAYWVDAIGSGVLLIALAWGAYMLSVYYRATID